MQFNFAPIEHQNIVRAIVYLEGVPLHLSEATDRLITKQVWNKNSFVGEYDNVLFIHPFKNLLWRLTGYWAFFRVAHFKDYHQVFAAGSIIVAKSFVVLKVGDALHLGTVNFCINQAFFLCFIEQCIPIVSVMIERALWANVWFVLNKMYSIIFIVTSVTPALRIEF